LVALDENARRHPHIVTVATSNFTEALDEAFMSRADLSVEVPLPNEAGVSAILQRALGDFGNVYPNLAVLAQQPQLSEVAKLLVGLDGRRIRKVLTEALASRRETVMKPNELTMQDLATTARRVNHASSREVSRATV